MNNRGFTLVELLAVIVVLSLLALLASTSITKIVKDSKNDLYNTQIELIKAAAETWGSDNLNKLPDSGECKYIELYDLKAYGLLESSIINPKTNQEFSNDMYIKISSNLTPYGNLITNYEVDVTDVSACSPVYPSICTLASDSEKIGTELGAKYICKVDPNKDEYTFYVLSNNEDGTTNLILDRNICEDGTLTDKDKSDKCLVYWQETGSNLDGPVTAMDYLYNATKAWNNVPNIIMDYKDEGKTDTTGYGKIITENGVTKITKKDGTAVTVLTDKEGYANLKARLPRYDEVHGEDKCLTADENNNHYGSCPLWLSNYLRENDFVSGEGVENISEIGGYWTLASYAGYKGNAWYVIHMGYVVNYSVNGGTSNGVRPVITVRL